MTATSNLFIVRDDARVTKNRSRTLLHSHARLASVSWLALCACSGTNDVATPVGGDATTATGGAFVANGAGGAGTTVGASPGVGLGGAPPTGAGGTQGMMTGGFSAVVGASGIITTASGGTLVVGATGGGPAATGGATTTVPPSTGGVFMTGGASPTGGSVAVLTGGAPAAGGMTSTGGSVMTFTGGAPPGGGMTSTGGSVMTFTGGAPATGGAMPTGGTTSTGGAMNDPFAADPVCTSGSFWTNGEGPTMRPGEACIACHTAQRGPSFAVAGTVYPTAHEPDDCNGASSGAVVVITDAQGMVYELAVNAAGNFYLENATLALPFTAKVVVNGVERAMSASQTSGDCNSCHTQQGASSAPGRIVLP